MSFTRSALVGARISRDPGQTREGVERQVQDAIDRINSLPDVELDLSFPGSPIDRKHPELGYWPAGVFVDNDISARKGSRKRRPEYERAMSHIKDGGANMIVSLSQSRLWRNSLQRTQALEDLKDLDVRLYFLKGHEIDLSRPSDKMIAGIIGEFDSYEAEVAAERQQDATRHAAKRGAYHGARPFGFRLAHLNPSGDGVHLAPVSHDSKSGFCEQCQGRKAGWYRTIVADETEAPAVVEAYKLVAAGVTPYAVCQYLDGQEIDGPDGARISRPAIRTAGGKRWEDVGVQSLLVILRARRNIGTREWSKNWAGGKRPAGELNPNAHWDGIVTEELFDAVQEQLARTRKARPGGSEPAHLLTGFAYCGACGKRLRIHKIKGRRRYACSAWQGKGCVSRDADSVEAEVQRVLYQWLAGNGLLTKSIESAGNSDLQKLYATRRKLRDQRDELADKLSDEIIDNETYVRLVARKNEQLAKVAAEIDTVMASGAAGTYNHDDAPTGAEFRTKWRGTGLTDAERLASRRAILARFVDKVVVHPIGAGNQPDPLLVQVFPGNWAAQVDGAQPAPVPHADEITSKGRIKAYINAHPGEWFTRQDVATATGVTLTSAHKNLTMLGAAGEVSREWRKRGGQRACYMFSAATGEAWGPHTRKSPGGGTGAREKVLTFLSDAPEWFSVAEIAEGSGAGTEAHTSRVLSELVAARFVQRRHAPLPRKDVRWQYSINGR